MHLSLLTTFILLACFCSTAPAAPRIACPAPEHDFGSADNSGSVEHAFTIANEGDETLKIGRIRACCGSSAKISSTAIEPGSNATFRVSLSLKGRKGAQRKSFYIASNDPRQPYFQVRMVGTAVASVDVQPRAVDFGRVAADATLTNAVTVTCAEGWRFVVTNTSCSESRFRAEVASEAPGLLKVRVSTVPPLAPGVTRGVVTLLTDGGKLPKLTIPVTATVSSDLVVVPREILLTEAEDAGPVTRYVAIRSRSGRAFRVSKVVPPDDGIEAAVTPLGAAGCRCELSNIIPFDGLDGSHVTFETDHPESPAVAVPVRIVKPGHSAAIAAKDKK